MGIEHLSDEQWGEMLTPHDSCSEHVSLCASCRDEWGQLQNLLSGLPQSAKVVSECPETFWEHQRLSIQSRINELPTGGRRSFQLAWVAAFALILIASLILRTGSRMEVPRVESAPDRQLLVQVEHALDGDVPEALQPASLLADEMNRSSNTSLNSPSSKEKNEHD